MIKPAERKALVESIIKSFTFKVWGDTLYFRDKDTGLYKPALGCDWLYGEIAALTPDAMYSIQDVDSLLSNVRVIISHEAIVKGENMTGEMDSCYISVANGVVDIRTRQLLAYTDDMVFTSRIETEYHPDAKTSEVVDAFMHDITCGDKAVENLLYEAIGYSLLREAPLRKGVMLKAKKRSGKSTLLYMIQALVGKQNCAYVDISNLSAPYEPATLVGKLVDIADDIKTGYIPDTSMLKKVVSGDPISVRRIYKEGFTFSPYCTIWAATNGLPRVADEGGAVSDRFVLIPMQATFIGDKDDTSMKLKLTTKEALEYVLRRAIDGLCTLLERKRFVELDISRKATEEWMASNNPVSLFVSEYKDDNKLESLDGVYADELYASYTSWCEEQGVQGKLSLTNFRSRVEEEEDGLSSGDKHSRVRSRKDSTKKTYVFHKVTKVAPEQERANGQGAAPERKLSAMSVEDLFDSEDIPF